MARTASTPKSIVKSYSAALESLRSGLGWVVAYLPFDPADVWGKGGKLKIRGEINGFAFRTSLFATREGRYFVLVNKRMQKGGHAHLGMMAKFRIQPDLEERTVSIPPQLNRILNEERVFLRWFETLNYSTRKWLSDWITDVKSAEARVRRAEQVAEQLMSAMEAERELPPVLKLAFARNPRAREGWEQMSPIQRRGQLIAIFYYRSPDARAKRIEKVLDEAAAYADKKDEKKQR